MDNTVKLIIEIPKEDFKKLVNPYQHNEIQCNRLKRMVMHGIPLDDVKTEIQKLANDPWNMKVGSVSEGLEDAIEILDNIGKENEDKE